MSSPSCSPNPRPGSGAADLDAGYSPSRIVPEYRSVLAEYRRLSDIAKERLPCELNVRYGEATGELLHHFAPRRDGSPLLVFVHGGHWQELSIDDSCFAAPALAEMGAGLVAVGYRLAPDATLDQMAASVARALEWVVTNATALGGTPQKIYAAGSSAGAHLLAMALSSAPVAASVRLAGVALLSGVYDLTGIRLSYVNDALDLTEADASRNSPVRFLPIRADEILVARGEIETGEYRSQHELLVGALRRTAPAGPREAMVRSLVGQGRNHFDLPLGLGDPRDELGRAVLRQMGLRSQP
ncbi:MAG: alpha/beta hydrolase [Actinomycetota bacterium]|nr:alpha/beta hydrolase [Actinomycetota bacterium]